MSEAATSLIPEAGVETWGIDGSIILYGVICDLFMMVPIILYFTVTDTNSYAGYHQTWINMAITAFSPLGITWWIVLADDSIVARTILKGAISSAGMGPFMLLWVGMASHLMQAKNAAVLTTANWQIWMFGFIYSVMNILLIIFHYNLAPVMLAWIDTAPLNKNAAIDNVRPWSEIVKVVADEVVEEEDQEDEEDEDEEEEEEEDEDEDAEEAF